MKTRLPSEKKKGFDEKKKRIKKILIIAFVCILILILYLIYVITLLPVNTYPVSGLY